MKTRLLISFYSSVVLLSCSVNRKIVRLNSQELNIKIAGNRAYGKSHQAGYNGVSELYAKTGPETNLFVPYYAGLNFEHIFNGDSSSYSWHIFEPRVAPMDVVKLSHTKVKLGQARTKNWPLKSTMTYELNANSIDFVFTGTPLADFWQKHGYIGIFIACYIHAPEDKGIHFIGRWRPGTGDTASRWVYSLPSAHGLQANQRPAGSHWNPTFDEGLPVTLASGFSDREYSYPFYYGRFGDYVLIMMFRNEDKNAEIRFAQSPDGAGPKNPAWDFMYFQRNCKVGRSFSFRAHAVFKKFQGEEDIIKTYESWSGEKVTRPQNK